MAVLPIRFYPDPVLKKKAESVEEINSETEKLVEDMGETMFAAEGVGLAAPQVGISCRLIVIQVAGEKGSGKFMALINPKLVSAQGETVDEEGCLSVKDYRAQVKRSQIVRVSYLDLKGNPGELTVEDMPARILQHEIDHLDGILFFERLSRIKRDLIKNRLRKQASKAD